MMFGGMLLWPLLIIGLVWWFVQSQRDRDDSTQQSHASAATRPDARALLDERYARGVIDAEQYREHRADLER